MNYRKMIRIAVLPSLLIGGLGQLIWAIIFINDFESNMFAHHWTIAIIGMIWAIIGAMICIYLKWKENKS